MGFSTLKNGVRVADNEKAYLDLLYFYMKGARYVFDPLHEVRVNKLNPKKICILFCQRSIAQAS